MDDGTVLLTGGAGVIGESVLARFPLHDPSQLVCLVHRRPISGHSFTALPADVSQPYLGLSRADYRLLARRVTTIIHSAAVTNVGAGDADIWRANVDGTDRMLQFATDADAPMHVLSTAFVADAANDFAPKNTYQSSKVAAEDLVRTSGLRTSILRPSVVIGDSTTGRIAHFQGFHFALAALMKGNFPVVPADAAAYIDFLPCDYVADVILAVVEAEVTGEHWITAGDEALTTMDVVDACVDFCAGIGRPIERPRLTSADIVERLVLPAFGDDLPPEIVKRLEVWSNMASNMAIDRPLPSSLPELAERADVKGLPDLRDALRRNLAYWATKSRWVPS